MTFQSKKEFPGQGKRHTSYHPSSPSSSHKPSKDSSHQAREQSTPSSSPSKNWHHGHLTPQGRVQRHIRDNRNHSGQVDHQPTPHHPHAGHRLGTHSLGPVPPRCRLAATQGALHPLHKQNRQKAHIQRPRIHIVPAHQLPTPTHTTSCPILAQEHKKPTTSLGSRQDSKEKLAHHAEIGGQHRCLQEPLPQGSNSHTPLTRRRTTTFSASKRPVDKPKHHDRVLLQIAPNTAMGRLSPVQKPPNIEPFTSTKPNIEPFTNMQPDHKQHINKFMPTKQ